MREHAGCVIAAVSLAGPATRISKDRVTQLAGYVIGAAAEICVKLGHAAAVNGTGPARYRSDGSAPSSAGIVAPARAWRRQEERNGI
ncbi:MAG: hypothetical protein ACREQB_05905 [Candidatus Binataceae bacterium]